MYTHPRYIPYRSARAQKLLPTERRAFEARASQARLSFRSRKRFSGSQRAESPRPPTPRAGCRGGGTSEDPAQLPVYSPEISASLSASRPSRSMTRRGLSERFRSPLSLRKGFKGDVGGLLCLSRDLERIGTIFLVTRSFVLLYDLFGRKLIK